MSLAGMVAMRISPLLLVVAIGCSSSGAADHSPAVAIQIQQLSAPDVLHFAGPVSLQYEVVVTNSSDQPLTLQRVELRTVGSGAYSLRNESTPLHLAIPPGGEVSKTISAWGYARGGNLSAEEPVTLRATAYFDAPGGSFIRMVSATVTQGGR